MSADPVHISELLRRLPVVVERTRRAGPHVELKSSVAELIGAPPGDHQHFAVGYPSDVDEWSQTISRYIRDRHAAEWTEREWRLAEFLSTLDWSQRGRVVIERRRILNDGETETYRVRDWSEVSWMEWRRVTLGLWRDRHLLGESV